MKANRKALAAAIAAVTLVVAIVAISERLSRKEVPGAGLALPAAFRAVPETDPLSAFVWHAEPRPFPAVALADGQGNAVTVGAFRGRVVLMNFWATWCAPCVREMPALGRLQARLGGADFTVIAVNQDRQGAEVAAPFIARHDLEALPVYYDTKTAVSRAAGVSGLPTTLLLDRAGRELGRLEGAAEWDSPPAVALMRAAIGAGGPGPEAGG